MADFQFQRLVASVVQESVWKWPRTGITVTGVAEEVDSWAELGGFAIQSLGQSARGREVRSVTIGAGPAKVLAWSQMHGDESTHTAVLLDLMHFLATQPGHEVVDWLLQNVTLILIPMLNPDGAEANTRRNAQGIDINRDARVLQSPEGQMLRDAVQNLKPQFAFNLHNHNSRRTVRGSNRLAAVALLTPPPEASDAEPEHLVRAKQLASCFCVAVAEDCEGMLSRYDADYMPRAFGEWVQRQGVSTLLVEAGGWPGDEPSRLVDVHFRGLLGALLAIATNEIASVGVGAYERLPGGEGHERIDCIVRNAKVQVAGAANQADIGINFKKASHGAVGWISDIGDLSVHDTDAEIEGKGTLCTVGRVAICKSVTPATGIEGVGGKLLSLGITTVVGVVDMKNPSSVATWRTLGDDSALPLNVAFAVAATEDSTFEELAAAVAWGAVAMVTDASNRLGNKSAAFRCAQLFGLSLVSLDGGDDSDELIDWHDATGSDLFAARGLLQLGAPADLVLYGVNGAVETVFVSGRVAFGDGRRQVSDAGRVLRRVSGVR